VRNGGYWGGNVEDACRYANVADQSAKQAFPDWRIHNCNDSYVSTAPVGRFNANGFGLYDMLGNVWEWTCSAYTDSYDGSERLCTENFFPRRVTRGGSWFDLPAIVRSANRDTSDPSDRFNNLGFRLARD
jgi:formylglycine-generating enzyme required for sulfatase activity